MRLYPRLAPATTNLTHVCLAIYSLFQLFSTLFSHTFAPTNTKKLCVAKRKVIMSKSMTFPPLSLSPTSILGALQYRPCRQMKMLCSCVFFIHTSVHTYGLSLYGFVPLSASSTKYLTFCPLGHLVTPHVTKKGPIIHLPQFLLLASGYTPHRRRQIKFLFTSAQ